MATGDGREDARPIGLEMTVGAREIFELTMGMRADINVLKTEVLSMRTALTDLDRRIETRFTDHEARLRALEGNRWPLRSIAVVVAVIGVILSYLALRGK